MSIYYEFLGCQIENPLQRLDETRIPRTVRDGTAARALFVARTEDDIRCWLDAHGGRYNTGPGAMNVRAILKWDNDGDRMVHGCVFPRYVWSS